MTNENKIKPEDEIAVQPTAPAFDTVNRFLVTQHNDKTIIMTVSGMRPYTKLEMLSLVAWVTVMAELEPDEVAAAVKAVQSC